MTALASKDALRRVRGTSQRFAKTDIPGMLMPVQTPGAGDAGEIGPSGECRRRRDRGGAAALSRPSQAAARAVIIVGRQGHASFKALGLI
jgi:hypothetical protein